MNPTPDWLVYVSVTILVIAALGVALFDHLLNKSSK